MRPCGCRILCDVTSCAMCGSFVTSPLVWWVAPLWRHQLRPSQLLDRSLALERVCRLFFRRRTFVTAGPLAFLSDAIARVGGRAISQASRRAHLSSRYRPIPSSAHHYSLLSGAKTQRPQTVEARGTGEVVVFKGLGCEHAPLHHFPTHLVFQFSIPKQTFCDFMSYLCWFFLSVTRNTCVCSWAAFMLCSCKCCQSP